MSRLFKGPRCFLSVSVYKEISFPSSCVCSYLLFCGVCAGGGIERGGVITLRLIASLTSTDRTHPISLSLSLWSTISTYSFDNPPSQGTFYTRSIRWILDIVQYNKKCDGHVIETTNYIYESLIHIFLTQYHIIIKISSFLQQKV